MTGALSFQLSAVSQPIAALPTFLAPWWVPVVAALGAVPPLVLLYFLKLKRRRIEVASIWPAAAWQGTHCPPSFGRCVACANRR